MRIQWDFNRGYQTEAVNAVVDLFKGQNSMLQYFLVSEQSTLDVCQGIGNKIDISNEDILENLRKIESYHRLTPSEYLPSLDFDIEMEKGTGKTYVYLKTIFELNKQYGFTKFVIVVSNKYQLKYVNNFIEDTKEHFKSHYDNLIHDYFLYDSSKLEQVKNFAVNSNIEIMIINIDSFNKILKNSSKSNIIHREQDKLSGYKPIDLIAETNPVVIIDEAEKVMQGKNEEAISYLNPLCTLRYSSNFKNINNLVYKLDVIDAMELNLYKQIELINFDYPVFMNIIYIKLISINKRKSFNTARIEINAKINDQFRRKKFTVKEGYDLSNLSSLDVYKGWIVDEINDDEKYISFTNHDSILRVGNSIDDLEESFIKRFKVRKTIEEHLEKELFLLENNYMVKVFSVFIFDNQNNLFKLNENNLIKGKYLKLFEEELLNLINNPKFSKLNYFKPENYYQIFNSIDLINSYELYDSDLKFIFINSDSISDFSNRNVFQVCNLTSSNEISPLSQVNIGIQDCIDSKGQTVFDKDINILTIITHESGKNFSSFLQKEIENNLSISFKTIKRSDFADIIWTNKKGISEPLGMQRSVELYNNLILNRYINRKGKIQNKLIDAINENRLEIPEDFNEIKDLIFNKIKNII